MYYKLYMYSSIDGVLILTINYLISMCENFIISRCLYSNLCTQIQNA